MSDCDYFYKNFPHTQNQKGHPVRAAYPLPVTVLGQNRLPHIRPGQIVRQHLIHDLGNILKDRAPVGPFLIIGRGGSDRKVISAISVPLRVNPVQGKGHDRQYIGPDRGVGPGGVNFTGRHVLDIVRVEDIVIPGCGIRGRSVMYNNVLRDDHPA